MPSVHGGEGEDAHEQHGEEVAIEEKRHEMRDHPALLNA
jgi:hypothetical protein